MGRKLMSFPICLYGEYDKYGTSGCLIREYLPTLLFFGAYPRMTEYDPPAPSITQRAATLRKAMAERCTQYRNGPASTAMQLLPINSNVIVWREGNTESQEEIDHGDDSVHDNNRPELPTATNSTSPQTSPHIEEIQSGTPTSQPEPVRRPQRNRQLPARYRDDILHSTFAQFDQSRKKEINGLLENGVFEVVRMEDVPKGTCIFNSRFVDEIKNLGTDKAFENHDLLYKCITMKKKISQRLLLCLAVCVAGTILFIRDVMQVYVQSTTHLIRDFYIYPPPELADALPEGTILKVVKPLYGIPESDNHWYRTYHTHHTDKLGMTSTYDPCLLHCTKPAQGFGITGMQTDDTLILADDKFVKREKDEIKCAGILCKPRECSTPTNPLKYNGGLISENAQGMLVYLH
ncbi:hypothetical protein TSTA_003330 [Talaromyces stipitatus ATCC 10500]|uniref:Uncharacterized protein n=1 Tax=Talaromyces stipitatus (strain ATCC 10500 / CBS 375.48 / QM 6759 / NRRL 1006) TaxID=441959 RepID=B8MT91_TALSN|nr:uncharacterized protein TSTA_003330 [Talaromyces stipitatus ATCC 10500]EED12274.1 hypothetical protein TSTA_003330 [Talaromyces stipitatus ATCC 10500]